MALGDPYVTFVISSFVSRTISAVYLFHDTSSSGLSSKELTLVGLLVIPLVDCPTWNTAERTGRTVKLTADVTEEPGERSLPVLGLAGSRQTNVYDDVSYKARLVTPCDFNCGKVQNDLPVVRVASAVYGLARDRSKTGAEWLLSALRMPAKLTLVEIHGVKLSFVACSPSDDQCLCRMKTRR